MTELLKQGRYNPMPVAEQVTAIYAGDEGYLDDVPVEEIVRFRTELLEYMRASKADVLAEVVAEGKLTDKVKADLNAAIEAFKTQFSVTA